MTRDEVKSMVGHSALDVRVLTFDLQGATWSVYVYVVNMGEPAAKRLCTVAAGAVKRIAVEGNIAAGKSTFLRILQEADPRYAVVSEPLTRWLKIPTEDEEATCSQVHGGNLLDLFYKEPKRWAYSFQTYACVSRLRAQLKPVSPDLIAPRNPVLFYERSVWSDRFVFAYNCHVSGLMTETEWHMYCDWHTFLTDTLPVQFDGIIYLRTDPKICYGRLQKRNRPEESTVEEKYLEALHDRHEQWLVDKTLNVPSHLERVPILTLDCDPEFEGDGSRAKHLLKQVADFCTAQ